MGLNIITMLFALRPFLTGFVIAVADAVSKRPGAAAHGPERGGSCGSNARVRDGAPALASAGGTPGA